MENVLTLVIKLMLLIITVKNDQIANVNGEETPNMLALFVAETARIFFKIKGILKKCMKLLLSLKC